MLTKEQRDEILRLSKALWYDLPAKRLADLIDYLDGITVPEGWQVVPVDIDLDAVAMQQMRQAAAESTWMPAEYSGSDWISDVCRWLRDGPPQPEPKRPAFLDEIDRAKEHVASWPQWMKDATVSAAATLPVTEPKREALRGLAPTHRCPACGAFWRQCDDASWNLRSASCCGLCDAGRVELVCWLDEPKREPLSDERIDEIGDPFGYFQYGDAQGDKRRAFARAVERAAYERAERECDPHEDDDRIDRQIKRDIAERIRALWRK